MIGQTNAIEEVNGVYSQLVNYTMLYYYGDECTDITGGWVGGRYITDYGTRVGTYTKNENTLYCKSGTSSSLVSAGFFTMNKINLSGVNKVWINIVEHYKGYACTLSVNATDRIRATTEGHYNNSLGLGLYNLDVSTLAQEMYIGFGCWAYASTISANSLFLTKSDDWQTLASIAGITASSIDDILTNASTLLSNEEAVKFMIYNCTGEFMAQAVANSTFLTALNESPYKTLVYANEHWAKFLNMVA